MNRILPVVFSLPMAGAVLCLFTTSKVEGGEGDISELKLTNLMRTELEVVEGVEVTVSLLEVSVRYRARQALSPR